MTCRCQASCIAVTCAIAFMLSGDTQYYTKDKVNVKAVVDAAFAEAKQCFEGYPEEEVTLPTLQAHTLIAQDQELFILHSSII